MAATLKAEPKELYDADFHVWTEVQAEHLRARRFKALDLDNLIEEVEAYGRAEKKEVLKQRECCDRASAETSA